MDNSQPSPIPHAGGSSPAAVTLFGATGFTGRLVARVLDREGVDFRIAGRSAERLRQRSADLNSRPAWLVADAQQPATLPSLLAGTRVLINCAGPFTDLGERVVARAAMGGVHYLDTTNELGYAVHARGYHEVAARTGAAITPACAFEVALADCAAHRAAERLGYSDQAPDASLVDEVSVVYALSGSSSRGTRRSAVRSLATSWIAYRDGVWTGQMPGGASRRFRLPGGERWGVSFPSCESITVPQHVRAHRVDTWMATSNAGRVLGRVFVPLLARLSRSILRGTILRIADRGGLAPDQRGEASPSPFTILVLARRGSQQSAVTLRGEDPYGLTAEIIAYAARRLAQPGVDLRGFLAPAQIVDPRALLEHGQAHWNLVVEEAGPTPIGRTAL